MIDLSRKDIIYKTVYINDYIDGVDNFNTEININFEVDVIILKRVVIVDNDIDNNTLFKLSTNLINDNILFTFAREPNFYDFKNDVEVHTFKINEDYNIPFQIKKGMGNINSTYNFKITTIDNESITNNKTYISLCLIFVKYNNS